MVDKINKMITHQMIHVILNRIENLSRIDGRWQILTIYINLCFQTFGQKLFQFVQLEANKV